MKQGIAICIPTRNHPSYFKEFVQLGLQSIYKKHHIDVYIYDSSENNETEEIIAELQHDGFSNFYYIKLHHKTLLDTKITLMLSGYKREKEYEYVWPCRDSTWFTEDTICEVEKFIGTGVDIIVLNPQNKLSTYYPPDINKKYTDINEFYHEVGAYLTGMMCRVLRSETILEDADWLYLNDKYRVWFPNGTFLEVALIFEQLSKISDSFMGVLLSDNISFVESNLKGARSHWRGQEFAVWGRCWPATIEKLPDVYENKSLIIKEKAHFNDIKLLRYLRKIGALNIKTFFRFRRKWHELSYISVWKFFLLSIMPRSNYKLSILKEEHYKSMLDNHFQKVYKLLEKKDALKGKKICIYGAGEVGKRVCEKFKDKGIIPWAYVQTECVLKNNFIDGIPIYEVEQISSLNDDDIWLIVSVVPRWQKEIRTVLSQFEIKNTLYL